MFRISRWLSGKGSACSAGDYGDSSSIAGWGRCPGGGNGYPLQYLPGKYHRQRSLAGYNPWGLQESDMIKATEHITWDLLPSKKPNPFAKSLTSCRPGSCRARGTVRPLPSLSTDITPWLTPWLAFIWGSHKLPLTNQPQGELKHFGHLWKPPPEDCEHASYTLALQRIRDDFLT